MTGPVVPLASDVQGLVNRAMDRVAGGRAIPGNGVTLLFDGPQIFPEMLRRIAAARKWIHLDNYIIRDDATGQLFADALCQRAVEGIRVRVVADWFGSFTTSRRFWQRLRSAGAGALERLAAVAHRLDLEAVRPQQVAEQPQVELVVLDNQDFLTHRGVLGDDR